MGENFDYKTAPDPEMMGDPSGLEPSRRGFLFWLGASINAVVGILIAVPVVGYIISPWKSGGWQKWTSLGSTDLFPKGETRPASYTNPFRTPWDGYTAETPCYVRHTDTGEFVVFAINCTHLGCPVRWFPESNLYMCPCHGGVYYEDGSHAAGPPPRGLYAYETRIKKGQLQVKAGRLPTLQQSV
jgi:Rieske Fe-S protein